MTFGHPWVLLFLLLPAAAIVWELSRRDGGRVVAIPLDHGAVASRPWLERMLTGAALLTPFLLAVAIVLLAGPRRLGPPGQERAITNIELVLDVSGSMSSPIGRGRAGSSRYTAAMDAINVFTGRRKGDAFGLTIFGGEVVRWVPLTRDLSAIRNSTPFLDPATMPSPLSSTRVGHALLFARDVLSRVPQGDRLAILITDGFSSDLSGGAAGRIGHELRESGVLVYGINVGDGPAPADLVEVVTPTGGQVFSAADGPSLNSIFEHIDRMNPARTTPTQAEPIDDFRPWAIPGLVLLGLHTLCLTGLRYVPW